MFWCETLNLLSELPGEAIKSLEARVVAPRLLAADNLDEFFEVRRQQKEQVSLHDLCVVYAWGDVWGDDDDDDGVATGD